MPISLTSTHLQSRSCSLTDFTASDQRLPSVVFKDFMESVLVLGAPVEGRLLLIFSLSASACSKGHFNVPLKLSAPTLLVSGWHQMSAPASDSNGNEALCLTVSDALLVAHHGMTKPTSNQAVRGGLKGVSPHLIGLPALCGPDTILHASRLCLKTREEQSVQAQRVPDDALAQWST